MCRSGLRRYHAGSARLGCFNELKEIMKLFLMAKGR